MGMVLERVDMTDDEINEVIALQKALSRFIRKGKHGGTTVFVALMDMSLDLLRDMECPGCRQLRIDGTRMLLNQIESPERDHMH